MLAVILAAGRGTRLAPLTKRTPKALVNIGGKPLLQVILEALPEEVSEIVIVVGHLKEQIQARFGAAWSGRAIRYVVQDPLDGTATAIRLTEPFVHGPFLVVNGDNVYAKADLSRLIAHKAAILLQSTAEPVANSALVGEHGAFLGLERNPPAGEIHRRVCGAYVLDERFFKYAPVKVPVRAHVEFSLPHTLVEMAKDVVVHTEEATRWLPVGTPEELARARSTS